MIDPEPTDSPAPQPDQRRPLPALVTKPLTLLLTIAIPQLLLLFVNLKDYTLISGEVDPSQHRLALLFFTTQLLLLIGGSGFAVWQWRKTDHIAWGWNWLIFAPHVLHLTFVTINLGKIVPTEMQAWILTPHSVIMHQFVFLMPAIFLSALSLACFPVRFRVGKDIGFSFLVALGIPLFWYVTLQVGHGEIFDALPEFMIFLMVVISSLICLTGVLRLLTMLFTWTLRKGTWGPLILTLLVGVIAPLGGLLLNRSITFPANFQIWPVYVLTVLNGLLLCVPRLKNTSISRATWLGQCALFPFTLYFFLTFLPWLPIAALAMIAAGAGFLILSPTALFILHLRKLYEGLPSRKWIPAGIVVALLLPAYAQIEMAIDRAVLNQAINYVYSPGTSNDGKFEGSRMALKRSLLRLKGIKEGVYLPFLTNWYNESVLDGFVLSDEKMGNLYFSFFGESIESVPSRSNPIFGGSSQRSRGTRVGPPPPNNAVLQTLTHSRDTIENEGTRTLVKLELHNPSEVQSEFATTIHLPEGVFISGYWLNVGEDRVPGQIFEKKTAMWVYRMIRDSRRDPGLLVYESPTQLSLRVFPFAKRETRITEIEFLSPPGVLPEIKIGDEIIPAENPEAAVACRVDSENQTSIFLSEAAAKSLPQTQRQPFLHFIIDRSATGLTGEEAVQSMKEVAAEFPEAESFSFSLVNYEYVDPDSPPMPISELKNKDLAERIETLPRRGAFLAESAMKRVLVQFNQENKVDWAEPPLHYPRLVLLRQSATHLQTPKSLFWYQPLSPDTEIYWSKIHGKKASTPSAFDGGDSKGATQERPVILISSDSERVAVPAGVGNILASLEAGEKLTVFDPVTSKFATLTTTYQLNQSSPYAAACEVRAIESAIRWNPALVHRHLPDLVEQSQENGILTPSTAYMVVENSAQWKMLKRKQKEKLKSNQALDFMEAPEPGLYFVIIGFGLLLLMRRMRTSGKTLALES